MGIEKITDRITGEAKAAYDETVEKARSEASSILAEAKEKADKILNEALAQGETEKENIIKYRKSVADIDAGKIILKKKQEILADCFDKATDALASMDEYEYIELLVTLGASADMYGGSLLFNADERDRIGQKVCDGLNAAVAQKRRDKYGDEIQYAERFTVAENAGDMKGGYIITYRSTFADCTIESLVKVHKPQLAGEAAKILFA